MSRAVDELLERLPALGPCRAPIEESIQRLLMALQTGGKILVCGNGGSAADSEHFVADLMKGFIRRRPIPEAERTRLRTVAGSRGEGIAAALQGAIAAIALASQGPLMTAIANDIRYDMVFAQQVYGLGRPGDVLIVISTTGNSPTVVNAACVAHLRGMVVIALTGRVGGEAATVADIGIRVPADTVFEIQELHLPVYHAIALALEDSFFPDPPDIVAEPIPLEPTAATDAAGHQTL
jgi:D-sedoheptulose 7-phosphate isomerase